MRATVRRMNEIVWLIKDVKARTLSSGSAWQKSLQENLSPHEQLKEHDFSKNIDGGEHRWLVVRFIGKTTRRRSDDGFIASTNHFIWSDTKTYDMRCNRKNVNLKSLQKCIFILFICRCSMRLLNVARWDRKLRAILLKILIKVSLKLGA